MNPCKLHTLLFVFLWCRVVSRYGNTVTTALREWIRASAGLRQPSAAQPSVRVTRPKCHILWCWGATTRGGACLLLTSILQHQQQPGAALRPGAAPAPWHFTNIYLNKDPEPTTTLNILIVSLHKPNLVPCAHVMCQAKISIPTSIWHKNIREYKQLFGLLPKGNSQCPLIPAKCPGGVLQMAVLRPAAQIHHGDRGRRRGGGNKLGTTFRTRRGGPRCYMMLWGMANIL